MSISVIAKNVGTLTEGPHWDQNTQTLLFVNITTASVFQWGLDAEDLKEVIVKGAPTVGAVVPRQQGGYVVAAGRHFGTLDIETGEMTRLAEIDKHKTENRFNDGKCDANGRFWAGTMGPKKVTRVPEQGTLYSLDKDHSVRCHVDKVTTSNGIAWNSDNTIMYYIDTGLRSVDAFDFDLELGTLSNRRTAVSFTDCPGRPDGMCIDIEGKLWVAMYCGSAILRVDPLSGKIMRTIEMPVSCPTSCCFGGEKFDVLYVTSASQFSTQEEQLAKEPLAGSVFQITNLGVTGLPANTFSG
ncbi:regucalcin-like [Saccoglossus kowalevskii]|uniref:Regucalcin n=1 Tax=Saccoglossus kowalevskii TaxID=10224 RepID=A0ABM0GMW6_SACKO|nr:PREDICTED: regucalcin-like [Saccoglossus kowalevskii]